MIRLDLSTSAVSVESDGQVEPFITVRTLQTEGSASHVARRREPASPANPTPSTDELTHTIASRQGANVLREYDINEPGEYELTSGRRELQQNRSFNIRVEFVDNATMQISVLPGSFPCPWVVDDLLHHYRGTETFTFQVRIQGGEIGVETGDVTRIEDDEKGVKYARTTAWERILQDDDPTSV
jgi:hypothetical protein